MNVKNTTGATLTLSSSSLSWGKWGTNPPSQIPNNQTASFYAEGAKGSATGTQGSVVYFFSDNATSFTISFDIPYSGANSGGLTLSGTGMSNYSAQETDSSYNPSNPVSFPSSGDSPTTYFAIGLAASTGAAAAPDFTRSVMQRFSGPQNGDRSPVIDIALAARLISCGDIAGPELVKIFQGKTEATAKDILYSDAASPESLVDFVARAKVLPYMTAIVASLDFAAHALEELGPHDAPHDDAIDLAKRTLQALRTLKSGETNNLSKLITGLEAGKGALLTTNYHDKNGRAISAIESVLACVYIDPDAAVAQTASCGVECAADDAARDRIAEWQLHYLQSAVGD